MSKKGFGLVEVVVAGALLVGLGLIVAQYTNQGASVTRKAALDMERVALTRHLFGAVDCSKSYQPGVTCSTAGLKQLLNSSSGVVVSSDVNSPTKLGEYTLRAECNAAGNGLIVKALRLTASGKINSTSPDDFLGDPVLKRKVTWSEAKSLLLPEGTNLCPDGNNKFSDSVLPGSTINWPHHFICDNVSGDTIVFQFHAYLNGSTPLIRYRDLWQRDVDFYKSNGNFKRCDACGDCLNKNISAIPKQF